MDVLLGERVVKALAFVVAALLALPGCGLYTMEQECDAKPDQASEIDGDMVGIVADEDGSLRTTKARDASFTPGPVTTLEIGPQLTFQRPPGPGQHRLEDLDARLCLADACTTPHGTVDVVVWEDDGIDATVTPEEAPIAERGAGIRGSARLLFRRWDHQVCRSVRKGSNSAFAVEY